MSTASAAPCVCLARACLGTAAGGGYWIRGAQGVFCSDAIIDEFAEGGEHYGQLVVYYRANNMIPPESRPH